MHCTDARLHFKYDSNWGYAEGFRRAADLLSHEILEKKGNPDYLIYPLGFLFHQHIELQLKWLIRSANELLVRREEAPKIHKLSDLWKILVAKLRELEPNEGKFLAEIDQTIAEICATDDTGEQFRYETLSNGKLSFAHVQEIKAGAFIEQRVFISDSLQAVRDSFAVRKDRNSEYLSYFQIEATESISDPPF